MIEGCGLLSSLPAHPRKWWLASRGNPDSGELVRDVLFRGLTFAHAGWTMDAKGYFDMQAGLPAPSAN
jgi:hypothetical protein